MRGKDCNARLEKMSKDSCSSKQNDYLREYIVEVIFPRVFPITAQKRITTLSINIREIINNAYWIEIDFKC